MIHGFDQKKDLFGQVLLDTRQWPLRGVVYSLLVHTMTFSAVLAISISGVMSESAPGRPPAEPRSELDLREVVYLPVLGAPPVPANGASAQAPPEGLSYPGPQTIASELPDPTSGLQTVLRPDLEDPVVLDTTIPLPNMVRTADRPAVIQAEAPTREVLVAPAPLPVEPEAEAVSEPVPLETQPLDPRRDTDFSALAEAIEALDPFPAPEIRVGLPERALERAEPKNLAALAPEPSPLEPLPVRRVDLALPTRTLEPAEHADLSGLGPERAEPVRPLPSRPVEVGLPTRTLAAASSSPTALDALARPRESIEVPPSQPVRPALPNRSLAAGESLDLAGLGTADRSRSSGLPVSEGPASTPGPRPSLSPLEMASPGGTDPDAGDFLALSPTPATTPGVLPPGESRGLFVISTRPNLDTAETRPGVRPEDAASVADQERPERIGPLLGNSPNDANEVDLATPGDPADPTEVASAGRTPAFPGITILAGGAGPEDAVDRDRPSGISVVGGSVEPGDPARTPSGAAPTSDTRASRPGDLQTSYGVTVLSTDTGGGGLPRFGVFTDEQVHTVFFDMRRTLADPAPAWTVEYGVPGGSRIQANLDPEAGAPPGQGLLLPFPVERHQPTFPSGIASRFPEQMVIAYGVIGVDGRIGEIGVKQSPDERLSGPVLEALSRWTFRPGRLDGVAVPVKMLLGIPIWVSQ